MAQNTAIEWADHTFNPWVGCTKVSPAGCKNCYAEQWANRYGRDFAQRTRTSEPNWSQPRKWNRQADAFQAKHGRRQRVFCASLADVFDNQVPAEWRDDLFQLVEQTPHLDWLLLTKRIGNVGNMLPVPFDFDRLYPNVWVGATICDQAEADRDIPKLLEVPARVRFLSIEPMLGDIRLGMCLQRSPSQAFLDGRATADMPAWTRIGSAAIDWVICGGESGRNARPMHPDWVRSLRDECTAAGVPFHFKQWGEWLPWSQFSDADVDDAPEQTRFQTRELMEGDWRDVGRPDVWDSKDGLIDDLQCVGRVGKKAAGRLLDGVLHSGFPVVTS